MKTLGPYTLLEEIGRGCMGAVYRARKPGLPRDFALKILLADADDPESIARFKQEAMLASKLEDRGVVGVFDVGEDGGRHYYVMEYCPGRTLEDRLAKEGRLKERAAVKLVAQLASTIHGAHKLGVVHRDLKPANIIIEEATGLPRITDFGLARDQSRLRSLTRTGDVLGTPYYMAPEQLRGKADARTDVWALGVILYESLSGQRPFQGEDFSSVADAVRETEPPLIRAFAPDVSDQLEAVVCYALAKDPGNRYLSAQALADDLQAILRGETPSHASGLLAPPSGGAGLKAALGALLVSVVVLGAYAAVEVRRAARLEEEASAREDAKRAEAEEQRALAQTLARAREAARPADADLPSTLAAFDRALNALPARSRPAHELTLDRARFLLRRGRPRLAVDTAYPLRGEEGDVGLAALHLVATAEETLGRRAEAKRLYEEIVHADPAGPLGLASAAALARLSFVGADMDRTSAAAVKGFPDQPAPLFERMQFLLMADAARNAPEVRALLERANANAPPSPRLLCCEALLEQGIGNASRAMQLIEAALAMGGDQPDPLVLRAHTKLLVERGDLVQAIASAERGLEIDPGAAAARFYLGATLWRHAQTAWEDPTLLKRAKAAWRKTYADAPQLHEDLVSALRDERLRSAVLRAVAPPGEPDPWAFELTDLIRRRLARAVEPADPAGRRALLRAMLCAAGGGPWAQVDRLYAAAQEAAPACPVVALERARVCVGRESYAQAFEQIERARRQGADADELDYLEALNYWNQGKAYEAAPRFEAIVERAPETQIGRAARANWLFAHERPDLAIKAAQAAVSRDPEHVPSLEIKACLLTRTLPVQLDMAKRVAEQGLALAGSMNLRLVRSRLSVLELRAFVDREGRPRQTDVRPSELRPVLAAYERLFPLTPGTGLLLDAIQNLLQLRGHHPWRDRLGAWIDEALRRRPDHGMTHSMRASYLLRNEGSKADILAAWRRARELEPRIFFSELTFDEFRERFGPSPELNEFVGRALPEPVPQQPEER